MKVHGVICRHCDDAIWSRHNHDFRRCSCGKTFVDGGQHYLRYGGDPEPTVVEIEVNE